MSKHRFLSTQELYGVDPLTLGDMRYRDALDAMEQGLWDRKRMLADELFACTDGDEASELQMAMKRTAKAIALTELKKDEINARNT
jgi:hypothetical protein